MAAPVIVELVPHDPRWPSLADCEAQRLMSAIGDNILAVHHIGSTAVPGLIAKPVLDLLPVVANLDQLDRSEAEFRRIGYSWWGENGLPGRRFCSLDDPQTGKRLIHLHCYLVGSPEIRRHLAFRDYLIANPDVIAEYARVKTDCRARHPANSQDYSACKSAWIIATERRALGELSPNEAGSD